MIDAGMARLSNRLASSHQVPWSIGDGSGGTFVVVVVVVVVVAFGGKFMVALSSDVGMSLL